jgi:hypothetical protein
MSTFEILSRLNFIFIKPVKKHRTSSTTKRIISRKYTTLTLNLKFKSNWVSTITKNLTIEEADLHPSVRLCYYIRERCFVSVLDGVMYNSNCSGQ